jgi:predicted RNase H-like nuclease
MNINCKKGLHIGVDGCRCGWIAAVLDYGELRIERYKSIGDLRAVTSGMTERIR